MNGVDDDVAEQSNDGNADDFEDSSEPQSKRFRADHENSNDYEAETSPWENPPNFNSNGAQQNNNNNQKGRGGGVGRRQGSRWSNRR